MREEPSAPAAAPLPPSRRFILGLLLALLLASAYLVREFLGAIVFALLIAFLLRPVYRRVLDAARYPTLAASIVLALFSASVVLPLAFIVQQLTDEALLVAELARNPDGLAFAAASVLARFGMEAPQASALVSQVVEAAAAFIRSSSLNIVSNLAFILGSLVVFLFLLFFALRDGDQFVETLRDVTPLGPRIRDKLFTLVGARVRAIALGTFLVSIIQGVVAGLGWWFFGFPAPFFWGFVMTVIAVLPLGAPFLVLVPAGIYALVQGDWFSGIGILVWAGVIVGLIDDVVRPYVVGRSAGVHPAIVLVGTLGGLLVFGVSGFLLGPLLLSMLEPVLDVWAAQRRDDGGDDVAAVPQETTPHPDET